MIIVMKAGAAKKDRDEVIRRISELGYNPHVIHGTTRDVIGAVGDERGKLVLQGIESMHGVESVVPILKPYKLASREVKPEPSVVAITDTVVIGGPEVIVMAGPCSVEGETMIIETAKAVKAAGAQVLRGGAFKPRTSPYSFQGLEEEGLKLLAKAREETGLPIVTEVVNPETAELVAEYSDILQIGARNAQNFALLKKVGQLRRPVLLKRGMSMTIQEFLMSAEYVMSEGNQSVILCERGIRTFETATRNTLDLLGHPGVEADDPPAGHCRSFPWHRKLSLRGTHGPGRCCRRRGRPHDRGASRSRASVVRRTPVAQAEEIRRAHGKAAARGGVRGQATVATSSRLSHAGSGKGLRGGGRFVMVREY